METDGRDFDELKSKQSVARARDAYHVLMADVQEKLPEATSTGHLKGRTLQNRN